VASPVETGPAYREFDQSKARDLVTQMKALSATADFAQLREAYVASDPANRLAAIKGLWEAG